MAKPFLKMLLLRLLYREDATGYTLMKRCQEITGIKPSPGSIYPILKAMEQNGIVTATETGSTVTYSLTPRGKEKLEQIRQMGISNITRVLAEVDDPKLPKDTINLVLFVDAYHEFEWPREVMAGVYDSLVSGGKVVLIEYRAEDPSVPIKRLHKMSEAQARKEMEAAGLVFKDNLEILPQQHFMIFEKP